MSEGQASALLCIDKKGAVGFEDIDNARHALKELLKRHNNVLSFQDISFSEEYANGRLFLVLDLERTTSRDGYHIYATIAANSAIFHSHHDTTVWVTNDDLWEMRKPGGQDEGMVLIPTDGISDSSENWQSRLDVIPSSD